jgi:hypothetical protein
MGLLLIILFGLAMPRLILFVCWLFGVFEDVWQACFWPVLGFLLMPYTTLGYAIAVGYGGGVEGAWMIPVVVGVILDLGSNGEATNRARRKRRGR